MILFFHFISRHKTDIKTYCANLRTFTFGSLLASIIKERVLIPTWVRLLVVDSCFRYESRRLNAYRIDFPWNFYDGLATALLR